MLINVRKKACAVFRFLGLDILASICISSTFSFLLSLYGIGSPIDVNDKQMQDFLFFMCLGTIVLAVCFIPIYLLYFYLIRRAIVQFSTHCKDQNFEALSNILILKWRDIGICIVVSNLFLFPVYLWSLLTQKSSSSLFFLPLFILCATMTAAAILIVPASLGLNGILPFRMPGRLFSMPFEGNVQTERRKYLRNTIFIVILFSVFDVMLLILPATNLGWHKHPTGLALFRTLFINSFIALLPALLLHSIWVWIRRRVYGSSPVVKAAAFLFMLACGFTAGGMIAHVWNLFAHHHHLIQVNVFWMEPFSTYSTCAALFSLSLP